jgi:hypothetical protein
MSEMSISATQEELVLSVLRDLGNGQVEDATGHFADQFRFKDHGIGLEFNDKSAWRSSSRKHGNSTQSPSFRLTRFFSVGIR